MWIAYDPDDTVVNPAVTEARFSEFTSPWKVLRAVQVPDGGDAWSPSARLKLSGTGEQPLETYDQDTLLKLFDLP